MRGQKKPQSEVAWKDECRHGRPERECDDCYNFARAQSEMQEHGTWYPPGDIVQTAIDSVLTKFGENCGVKVFKK
jgi:hypothetical protein